MCSIAFCIGNQTVFFDGNGIFYYIPFAIPSYQKDTKIINGQHEVGA